MPPVGRHPRRRVGNPGLRRRTNVQPVGAAGPRRPRRPPGRPGSQPATAAATAPRSVRRLWSPATVTTVRPVAGGGIPKGSRSPWTTSTGTATASSSSSRLGAGAAPARRLQREREADDARRARRRGRAAGHAGPRGPPAHQQRPAQAHDGAQVLDDRGPGGVEPRRRGRRAASRDAVGLLDERHGHPGGLRGRRHGDQVPGGHAAAGAVAQHEPRRRPRDGVHVGPRGPGRRVDLDEGQARRARSG